ncbi:MAG: helix-turn-helix domain-containing protein [Candidatus Thorarchaeota archaeon]
MVIQTVIEVSSEHYYSCELTRRLPVRVSIVTINGDTGLGILEPLEDGERSLQRYVRALRASPSTSSVDVTYRSPSAYWTHVVHKIDGPSIYDTVLQSGCMTFLPIVVEKGIQKHTVLAPTREVLRDLIHLLRARFTTVRVKKMRSTPLRLSDDVLTPKQTEAIQLAFQFGYYEIPRKCTVSELALKIGIRRVAMQERLRRAERRILSSYFGGKNKELHSL